MRESAVQRPTLIHTGGSGNVSNCGGPGSDKSDVPAIGGKRTAIRARKMSPQDMVAVLLRWRINQRGESCMNRRYASSCEMGGFCS
jgi:hypothetical protein